MKFFLNRLVIGDLRGIEFSLPFRLAGHSFKTFFSQPL